MTSLAGRPACVDRPADWWDTGDGGNRLAMTMCRLACPLINRCPVLHGGRAYGVVAAGQAWTDAGVPAPVCKCGRPVLRSAGIVCLTCDPPPPRRWNLDQRTYWRQQKRRQRAEQKASARTPDMVAIDRVVGGDRGLALTAVERRLAIDRFDQQRQRLSAVQIADRLGTSPRTVQRRRTARRGAA